MSKVAVSLGCSTLGLLFTFLNIYHMVGLRNEWIPKTPHNEIVASVEGMLGATFVTLGMGICLILQLTTPKVVTDPSKATQAELIALLMKRAHFDASQALQNQIGGLS